MTTAELGQLMVLQKLTSLGASNAIVQKEGNRSSITFDAPNGKTYKVTARAKTSGTWQTSTNYAAQCTLDKNDNEFWVFIDLGREPNTFYVTPLSWIRNDIYTAYMGYLEKHGGHRAQNDESTHHAISVKRIAGWEDAWREMGLSESVNDSA
ncbi:hypothetical protein HV164_06925 [Citrobacter freundii]|uniref:Uncharacterized protein n=2 Tax=Enterobacterales TaxID=91347 RepID=A0ABD7AWE9_CITFR|nr:MULTISPECIES: hypothetical protein [Enterobacteriaceae]EKN3888137.1 hypothetical protein [Yersinia enterocolitica]HDR2728160.1 hypothetical protein [Enterobacter roggenkampii]EKN5063866.1 hypothetical protein [Yersinia enterocolitica]EKN6005545.1 hypothetical protein [Yersinia enterocolitica]ELI8279033.1 hypothetical protein [Yersinia enterocolitica]